MSRNYDVFAWYFPNWHPDPRNDEWHGKGWTEWETLKCARPRFPGHDQPKIPLWGYPDESDPNVMELKIRTAKQYGIDGFLWDMYWFEDGGYRMNALDKGFFGAKNNEEFKIALIWCNHDPIYAHPATRRHASDPLLNGDLSPEGFRRGTEYFIEQYFWRPNYYRADGKLYFMIYLPQKLVSGIGGIPETRDVLDDFRERVRRAGLGEVYLAANIAACPGAWQNDRTQVNAFASALGFDGFVQYGCPRDESKFPRQEYADYMDAGIRIIDRYDRLCDLPYNPSLTVGWDVSPRTLQSEVYEKVGYPWQTIVDHMNSADFARGLRGMKAYADSERFRGHFVTLTAWNEWTEGNYLEPDLTYGYSMLEAVKKVFGTRE